MEKHPLLEQAEIEAAIFLACRANDCPDFAKTIRMKWSNHIVQTTGQFHLAKNEIKLAAKVLCQLPKARQVEAVVREVCHLIAWHQFHDTSNSHVWHNIMRKAGYDKPARIMENLPVQTVQRLEPYDTSHSPFFFSCACRQNYTINPVMAKSIALDGKKKDCPKCGKLIVLVRNDLTGALQKKGQVERRNNAGRRA